MGKIEKKRNIRYAFIFLLIIAIFSLSAISINTQEKNEVATNASVNSNKKIGWGIKRNDNHEQPDCRK